MNDLIWRKDLENVITGFIEDEADASALLSLHDVLAAVREAPSFAPPEARADVDGLVARLLNAVTYHWPDIGVDQSDSTWLECSCGWDSSKKGSVDWATHLLRDSDIAALLAGDKAEAPR